MCGPESTREPLARGLDRVPPEDQPPDWRTMPLPPVEVLRRLTDAHCHPTDMAFTEEDVEQVGLGGIAAMATRTSDQDAVCAFGEAHGRSKGVGGPRDGVEVIACFGYHPWFSHLLSLADADALPSKADHYAAVFLPPATSKNLQDLKDQLDTMLPDLPEPIAFGPLLTGIRRNIQQAKARGQLVMLGEVGLDKSFRVPFPRDRKRSLNGSLSDETREAEADVATSAREEQAKNNISNPPDKVLSPFRPSMEHQVRLLELQMEVAVEQGVNVSLHSVQCQGPTIDFLRKFVKKHGKRFLERVNVDVHSCGGWSVESWLSMEKSFPNLYMSPSLAISARSPVTPSLIRAVAPDRLLVESDTHLIGDTTRRVWAAAVWIGQCRKWHTAGWTPHDEQAGQRGPETITTLEQNWRRFMRLDS